MAPESTYWTTSTRPGKPGRWSPIPCFWKKNMSFHVIAPKRYPKYPHFFQQQKETAVSVFLRNWGTAPGRWPKDQRANGWKWWCESHETVPDPIVTNPEVVSHSCGTWLLQRTYLLKLLLVQFQNREINREHMPSIPWFIHCCWLLLYCLAFWTMIH